MIKTEVLFKVQHAKTQVENEETSVVEPEEIETKVTLKKSEKRKRKISSDKIERKDSTPVTNKVDSNPKNVSETNKNVKPFVYKNVNYRKFYDDSEKTHNHKQLKTKYKKSRK